MGNCTSNLPAALQNESNLQDLLISSIKSGTESEQIEEFIKSKVDVNTEIEYEAIGSCYPIHMAAKVQNGKGVKMLLKAGANPKVKDNKGKTALHWAAQGSNLEIVQDLLQAGCDCNGKSEDGTTPLKEAIIGKNQEIVDKLIENNANVNISDSAGDVPLAVAVNQDNKDACISLLKAKTTPPSTLIVAINTWASKGNYNDILMLLETKFTNEGPKDGQDIIDSVTAATTDGGALPNEIISISEEAVPKESKSDGRKESVNGKESGGDSGDGGTKIEEVKKTNNY